MGKCMSVPAAPLAHEAPGIAIAGQTKAKMAKAQQEWELKVRAARARVLSNAQSHNDKAAFLNLRTTNADWRIHHHQQQRRHGSLEENGQVTLTPTRIGSKKKYTTLLQIRGRGTDQNHDCIEILEGAISPSGNMYWIEKVVSGNRRWAKHTIVTGTCNWDGRSPYHMVWSTKQQFEDSASLAFAQLDIWPRPPRSDDSSDSKNQDSSGDDGGGDGGGSTDDSTDCEEGNDDDYAPEAAYLGGALDVANSYANPATEVGFSSPTEDYFSSGGAFYSPSSPTYDTHTPSYGGYSSTTKDHDYGGAYSSGGHSYSYSGGGGAGYSGGDSSGGHSYSYSGGCSGGGGGCSGGGGGGGGDCGGGGD